MKLVCCLFTANEYFSRRIAWADVHAEPDRQLRSLSFGRSPARRAAVLLYQFQKHRSGWYQLASEGETVNILNPADGNSSANRLPRVFSPAMIAKTNASFSWRCCS